MDDSNGPSHYVRLRKEKEPLEEITPGELNQPVQVPQVGSISIPLLFNNHFRFYYNEFLLK